jgi:hypothetical protein
MPHNTSAASSMTNAYLHAQDNLYDRVSAKHRPASGPGNHGNAESQISDKAVGTLDRMMASLSNPELLRLAREQQLGEKPRLPY